MKINKFKNVNPFNLTLKQRLFVMYLVSDIVCGRAINPTTVVEKVYSVKNRNTAKSIASENLTKPNIVEAMEYSLEKHGILGPDGKITERLTEGLDAVIVTGGYTKHPHAHPDYKMRLAYIREILAITMP